MKIAVTSTGPSLDAAIDPRFGRCSTFVIVETDDLTFEAMANPSASLGGGAGIQAARWMAEKGVKAVLSGDFGPNAHEALSAAHIDAIAGCTGLVSAAVARFTAGELHASTAPSVGSHSGLRGETR